MIWYWKKQILEVGQVNILRNGEPWLIYFMYLILFVRYDPISYFISLNLLITVEHFIHSPELKYLPHFHYVIVTLF